MKNFYFRYADLQKGVMSNSDYTSILWRPWVHCYRAYGYEYVSMRWKNLLEDAEIDYVEYGDFSATVKTRTVKAMTFYCNSIAGCVEGESHYSDGDGSINNPWRSLQYASKMIELIMQSFYMGCCENQYYFQIKVTGAVDYRADFIRISRNTSCPHSTYIGTWKHVRDLILDFNGCKFDFGAEIWAGYAWVRNISADINADSRENSNEKIMFYFGDHSITRDVELKVAADTIEGMENTALDFTLAEGPPNEETAAAYNIRISQNNFLYAQEAPYSHEIIGKASDAVICNISIVTTIDSQFENVMISGYRMYDCSVNIVAEKVIGANGIVNSIVGYYTNPHGWYIGMSVKGIEVSRGGYFCNVECSVSVSAGTAFYKDLYAWGWGYSDVGPPSVCNVVFYHCTGTVSAGLDCKAYESSCPDEHGQYQPCTKYTGHVKGKGFKDLTCATFYDCSGSDICIACSEDTSCD